jgi:hypothetical protein
MVLAASTPVQTPAMLTEWPGTNGFAAPLTSLPIAPVHRHAAMTSASPNDFTQPVPWAPIGTLQVGPQHRGGGVDNADRIVFGQCVNPSERTELLRPQHFASVNVADTTHHALIEQYFTNLGSAVMV